MIRALVFDFDGLILDTETPEFQTWQEIYRSHGTSLSLPEWADFIGSNYTFNPYDYLEHKLGRSIDRPAVRAQRQARFSELMADQALLPGVEAYLSDAREMGLRLGLASSSSQAWVMGYVKRFELAGYFDSVKCADDVQRTKPDPALFAATVSDLRVAPQEAIALEDSPNGVLAAKRAGLICVAVPNTLTRQLSFDLADLQIPSLAALPLRELVQQLQA